ncbi:MurR/RpiR family transcriptional regulator [Micromonospora sp. CPCC 205371]|nr:MurR/RpiR family transcriptional regulator [Micromonospora sp. CPCC 205371]
MVGRRESQSSPASGGALSRLEAARQSLSATERRVADRIIRHPEEVLESSMLQVARQCGVSDTTVLRTCRAAGLAGFTELKLRLAWDLASPTQLIHNDVNPGDPAAVVAEKVFGAAFQSLHDTLELLDADAFERAVELLEQASAILVGGVGASGVVAQAFYQRCRRLGLNCDAPTDSQLQIVHASLMRPGDLAVAISFSGTTKLVVQMLEQAKSCGATTIAITGNLDSPLAALGDVVLRTVSRETRSEHLAARVCQITLLDALYVAYSLRHVDEVLERESRIIDAVGRRLY